ncbi:hypothetical protein BJX70DRAFT_375925 [Aspergillus crustosus]
MFRDVVIALYSIWKSPRPEACIQHYLETEAFPCIYIQSVKGLIPSFLSIMPSFLFLHRYS